MFTLTWHALFCHEKTGDAITGKHCFQCLWKKILNVHIFFYLYAFSFNRYRKYYVSGYCQDLCLQYSMQLMVNPVTNLLILSVYRCKECLSTKSGRLKQSNVLLHPNVTLHPSVNWKSPTQRKFQLSVIKSDEWKSQNFNIVYIELYW